MTRNKSDIFESFIKIAQEKGIISNAAEPEHTGKNTKNPRWDSLDEDKISKLYNNKTPSSKDMEYENNIMEIAHKDPLVLSPSHDKLNGLVESEQEGQNIRLHIALKEPDGHLTQRKYAEKQFLLSLVRVGNYLDNRNEEQLCKLADACLVQASGMKKKAFWMIAIPIAAALGAIYIKNHMSFHSDGFAMDYQKAIAEIDDLLTSNANIVGYSYRPEFIQTVTDLKNKLEHFYSLYVNLAPILDKMEAPKTTTQLEEMAKLPESQNAFVAIKAFSDEADNFYPYFSKIIQDFSSEEYKQRAIADKGTLSKLVDVIPGLHGGYGLIADDFDDVVHALKTLFGDVTNTMKGLQTSEEIAKEVQSAANQTDQVLPPEQQDNNTPKAATEIPANESAPWDSWEKSLNNGL